MTDAVQHSSNSLSRSVQRLIAKMRLLWPIFLSRCDGRRLLRPKWLLSNQLLPIRLSVPLRR